MWILVAATGCRLVVATLVYPRGVLLRVLSCLSHPSLGSGWMWLRPGRGSRVPWLLHLSCPGAMVVVVLSVMMFALRCCGVCLLCP